ncbi:MAG: hypothetical protein ACYTFY_20285 [Planctomycetota bacterium]|jgi:tetratricopeptide (TPR) repeat protein
MPEESRQNPLFQIIKERLLVLLGSALLVIFFSALFGWIGGAVYKWGNDRVRRTRLQEMTRKEGVSEIDKYIAYLKEAAKEKPRNAGIKMELARAYVSKGRKAEKDIYFNEALVEAESAWKIHRKDNDGRIDLSRPKSFTLRVHLADIYYETENREKAAVIYYEVLDFVTENPASAEKLGRAVLASFYNNTAYFILTEKNLTEKKIETAYQLIKKCIKSGPAASSSPAFLDTLALALYKKGRKEDALRAAREALAKADSSSLEVFINRYEFLKNSVDVEN